MSIDHDVVDDNENDESYDKDNLIIPKVINRRNFLPENFDPNS